MAAVDNIDHNPSSTTAKDSFHGTGISLFQQPTVENPGTDRGLPILNDYTNGMSIAPLPESYTTINPVIDIKKDPPLPTCRSCQVQRLVLLQYNKSNSEYLIYAIHWPC